MNARDLIEAKQRGVSFTRILHAVEAKQEISQLPEDQSEFFESMIKLVEESVSEVKQAVREGDVSTIRKKSEALEEIWTMMKDCCDSRKTTDK